MTQDRTDLNKRLLLYSTTAALATTAVAAGLSAAPAQAAQTVIDVNPDETVTGPLNDFFLDFDQDGNDEFRLLAQTSANVNQIFIRGTAGGGDSGTGVVGYSSAGYIFPSALNQGVSVCTTAAFEAVGNFRTMAMTGTLGTYGAWRGVTSRYLGLRFTLDGTTHVGWAELDVAADASEFTIKRYGYETDPVSTACIPTAVSLTDTAATAAEPWWRAAAVTVMTALTAVSLWLRRRISRDANAA